MTKNKCVLSGFVFLLTASVLIMTGCKNTTPLDAAYSDSDNTANISDNDLNFIFLSAVEDDGMSFLKKDILVQEFITADKGGTLELKYNWIDESSEGFEEVQTEYSTLYKQDINLTDKSKVKITLKVLPDALDEDMLLSLDFNDSVLAMTFAPHGLVFNTPAILNIKVKDVDLTAVGTSGIGVYYENLETGTWDLMESEKTSVSVKDGKLEIKNALLPHFSRYAVAYGR